MEHVRKDCLSDPIGISLRYTVQIDGHLEDRTARGSSGLEGYHNWLEQTLAGNNFSPHTASLLISRFNSIHNIKTSTRLRLQPDYGHFDMCLNEVVQKNNK